MTCAGCEPCPMVTVNLADRVSVYELHVTVRRGPENHVRWVCETLGVKLTIILVQRPGGSEYGQIMTSQTVHGDWRAPLARTVRGLRLAGLGVLREKVEAAPWNKEVPTLANGLPFPEGTYLEGHLLIALPESPRAVEYLRAVCSRYGVHVSRSEFKPGLRFVTVRQAEPLEHFNVRLGTVAVALQAHGLRIEKTITEFTLHDTNLGLDKEWVSA